MLEKLQKTHGSSHSGADPDSKKQKWMEIVRQGMQHHTFGVASLPSESINLLMHNDFNRQYLHHKLALEDTAYSQRKNQLRGIRSRYETLTQRAAQQKSFFGRNGAAHTQIDDRRVHVTAPGQTRRNKDAALLETTHGHVLPPLDTTRSVGMQNRPLKFVDSTKRNNFIDRLQTCEPPHLHATVLKAAQKQSAENASASKAVHRWE